MPPPLSPLFIPQLRRLAAVLVMGGALVRGFAADPGPGVVVPRFTHPGAGQVYYFVLPDRFANGDKANDTGGIPGGPDEHGFDPARITHYHGGDLAGLTARLDYLKNLGVTAIWVTPPFRNQTLREKPGIGHMAAHHGYWILDFLHVDPHLGTDEEFRSFVREAHGRGLKVCLDIVVNHTADVIHYDGDTGYQPMRLTPYRDAAGRPFNPSAYAYNALAAPAAFPALSAAKSFAQRPVVSPAGSAAKNPAWLNDPTLYHNRGNRTRTVGESAVHGDFGGLDDLFTEHPRVVQGFIEIFGHWLEHFGVDGFRIDTARHVNLEFWQAFMPAMRARAHAVRRPHFLAFGEVYNDAGDPAVLSEFSTGRGALDATLDFGFFALARQYVAQGAPASLLADFFARDDYYTDHDSNVHSTTTFLGNHDAGRFAYFLQRDNPRADPVRLAELVKLGHGLLYLTRGQPVIYYGDEQGMIGRAGDHERAREDMFPAQAPGYKDAILLGTARTGGDDKFDEQHPLYRFFQRLGALRARHQALRTGAMIVRPTQDPGLFAFSRIERGERVEYLVALNNSRTATLSSRVPTSQPAGALLQPLFASHSGEGNPPGALTVEAGGSVVLTLPPLQFAVWRAAAELPPADTAPRIALSQPAAGATLKFGSREVDGLVFPGREEIRATVEGGDGFAEVTFAMTRASRPGQFELLGTDDAAPYRVFWSPPPDLVPGEELTFIATVSDLRGHRAVAQVDRIKIAEGDIAFDTHGATVPVLKSALPTDVKLPRGQTITLMVAAEGTGPLEYQWLRDDTEVPGATSASLAISAPGRYSVLIRNRAGTTVSPTTWAHVSP